MIYRLERSVTLVTTIDHAWEFFSNPANLTLITPPSLNFKIISEAAPEMYPGMLIIYKVHPVFSIPMTWVSEITQVKKHAMFIDEQRIGPYRLWHHQHFFKAVDGGVEVRDIVKYVMPFGLLGRFVHPIIVKQRLNEIFDFRANFLSNRYGLVPGSHVGN